MGRGRAICSANLHSRIINVAGVRGRGLGIRKERSIAPLVLSSRCAGFVQNVQIAGDIAPSALAARSARAEVVNRERDRSHALALSRPHHLRRVAPCLTDHPVSRGRLGRWPSPSAPRMTLGTLDHFRHSRHLDWGAFLEPKELRGGSRWTLPRRSPCFPRQPPSRSGETFFNSLAVHAT
jgi:hypothetical protein